MCRIKEGFTLAEVLITLVIIGIVAAITIPTLIRPIINQKYVSSLKKFYSETNQILLQVAADNCGVGSLECGTVTNEIIAKYYKKTKVCTGWDYSCWADVVKPNYDGSGVSSGVGKYGLSFVTLDGMSVELEYNYPLCNHPGYSSTDPDSPYYKNCGTLSVDVNGHKGPNFMGRDVFIFSITSNKMPMLNPSGEKETPYGHYWNGSDKTCQTGHPYGFYCAGRVVEEGWQMNY